ncbi:MAG: thrombospondin type 3 repeat-containing protein [Myxococcota bacterium]|nr:thrombospondin type 3 repeat-containing protein [Myxococcota bacterium]
MRVCLLWVLASCSFSASPLGSDAGDPPTQDATSDAAGPDLDAAAMPDADGDGIADAADNCPTVANLDQRDHDLDARGDACDHCPHLPDPTDPDGDGDGLGDACDPRPAAAGDTLITWDGFYADSTVLATWTMTNGTWSVGNGTLRQTNGQTVAFATAPGTIARVYAAYGFTAVSVGPPIMINGTPYAPAVGDFAGVAPNRNYGCAMSRDPGNRITAFSTINGVTQNSPAVWNGDFATGQRYKITQHLASTNDCTFVHATTTASDSGAVGVTSGTFSLFTTASAIDFDYVFLVEIGS